MAKIEMSQMVQPKAAVKAGKAPPDSAKAKTDFERLMKEKDQAVREEANKPKTEKTDDGKDTKEAKDSQKKEHGPELSGKDAGVQAPAEVMLGLLEVLNRLGNNMQLPGQSHGAKAAVLAGVKQSEGALKEGLALPGGMTGAAVLEETEASAGLLAGKELLKTSVKADAALGAAGKEAALEPGAEKNLIKTAKTAGIAQASQAGQTAQTVRTAQTVPALKTAGPERQTVVKTPEQPIYKEALLGKNEPGHGKETLHKHNPGENPADAQGVQNGGNHALLREAPAREPSETVTVRTTPETFTADLGKALGARMPGNNGTLSIELEPASLGKMTIKVVYEAGRAAVSIMSANPKTLELLSRSAGELAQILEQKTGQQTVIYTPQQPQQEMDGRQGRQEGGERSRDQERENDKGRSRPDSFAQQLRLGLV